MLLEALSAFLLTLCLVTVAGLRFRVSPFFILIGGAIVYGILTGMAPDQLITDITAGLGQVFATFAIIILSGSVIARLMQEQDHVTVILADIHRVIRSPWQLAGTAGFLLSVPVTCCITAYVMLIPLLDRIRGKGKFTTAPFYLAAIGSIISYALIYPTPVVIPLLSSLGGGISPVSYDLVAIPVSLLLLGILFMAAYFVVFRNNRGIPGSADVSWDVSGLHVEQKQRFGTGLHLRAWAPFLAIILAIPVGLCALGLSQGSLIQVIMLAGAFTAIVLAPGEIRPSALQSAAKHGGIIIFDICGAGALGAVIVGSSFTEGAVVQMSAYLPVIVIPFILAALIATAQGSRVVTAVITAHILAGSTIAAAFHPVPLILMVAAGSCIISYVTDPFFWLVQRTTGDTLQTVTRCYTIPLAGLGIILFFIAFILAKTVFMV
jgi:H+/gluconate symporter and related permeases